MKYVLLMQAAGPSVSGRRRSIQLKHSRLLQLCLWAANVGNTHTHTHTHTHTTSVLLALVLDLQW